MAIDWNVLVSLRGERFRSALRLLDAYGSVSRTGFYNLVALRVADLAEFLERLRDEWAALREIQERIGHVFPAQRAFAFTDADELVARAAEAASEWLPRLAGRSFHVRVHRRGLEGVVSTHEVEQRLGGNLLEALARRGESARVAFEDADEVVAVETAGHRAGVSIWSRRELARYPFLHLD